MILEGISWLEMKIVSTLNKWVALFAMGICTDQGYVKSATSKKEKKMESEEYKLEDLKELEHQVLKKAVAKLNKMLKEKKLCNLFGKCEEAHLSEMVKVCHQIRSLVESTTP